MFRRGGSRLKLSSRGDKSGGKKDENSRESRREKLARNRFIFTKELRAEGKKSLRVSGAKGDRQPTKSYVTTREKKISKKTNKKEGGGGGTTWSQGEG